MLSLKSKHKRSIKGQEIFITDIQSSHSIPRENNLQFDSILNSLELLLNHSKFNMNSYAVVFAALILAVQGGSLRLARQEGWGAPPPSPSIEIVLEAEAAAEASGSADASLELLAEATGTEESPVLIDLVGGTAVDAEQELGINQIAFGDLLNLSSSSLNSVTAANLGVATDGLLGTIAGGLSASLVNNGADNTSGTGSISNSASTSNVEIS